MLTDKEVSKIREIQRDTVISCLCYLENIANGLREGQHKDKVIVLLHAIDKLEYCCNGELDSYREYNSEAFKYGDVSL